MELTVPPAEEEEAVNKQSTTILEQVRAKCTYQIKHCKPEYLIYLWNNNFTIQNVQALCRAEDEEDIVAASQAKAEQVAELAEFNENIPLDDGAEQEEVEEMSKAEQEIAALVEQVNSCFQLMQPLF